MTYRHIKFTDSEIMKTFERVAFNKGLIKLSWYQDSPDFGLNSYNKEDYLEQVEKYKKLPPQQRGVGTEIPPSADIDRTKLLPDCAISPNPAKFINEIGFVSALSSASSVGQCYSLFKERESILDRELLEIYEPDSVRDLKNRSFIFAFIKARNIKLKEWGLQAGTPLPFYKFSAPPFPSEFEDSLLIQQKSKKTESTSGGMSSGEQLFAAQIKANPENTDLLLEQRVEKIKKDTKLSDSQKESYIKKSREIAKSHSSKDSKGDPKSKAEVGVESGAEARRELTDEEIEGIIRSVHSNGAFTAEQASLYESDPERFRRVAGKMDSGR